MNNKIIALVDWSWLGHHPNYFVNYAVALAQAGYRVLPLCSEPNNFTVRLSQHLSLNDSDTERKLIDEPIVLNNPVMSNIQPRRYRGIHNALRRFGGLGKFLRKWERSQGEKIHLVFFACIYEHQFKFFTKVERRFGFRWSGLYLHPRSFRILDSPMCKGRGEPSAEKILSSGLMQSIAVLDEGVVEIMSEVARGKPVIPLPDFTDECLPDAATGESGLANKIRAFAGGRPIVCLMGYLYWTKGFCDFTEVAQHPSMRNVIFFLGGELNWAEIDNDKSREVKQAWANSHNILTHFTDLTDGQINAVISVSNVVYAAYRDFPSSSNMLTKAAVFKKPVLVSDGYVMAERVRKYETGEVVSEGNIDDIAKAIQRMLADGYCDELKSRAQWEEYHALHSIERLPECFEKLLSE